MPLSPYCHVSPLPLRHYVSEYVMRVELKSILIYQTRSNFLNDPIIAQAMCVYIMCVYVMCARAREYTCINKYMK